MYGELRPCEDLGLLHRPSAEAATSFEVEIELREKKPAAVPTRVRPLTVGSAGQAEVRLGGFGGQGIILSGKIVGKAAALYDGREVTLTQSYGPESRGGACSTALVISDDAIPYPHVTRPAVMTLMSQEAYTTYHGQLAEGGLLLIDSDLVEPDQDAGQRVVPIPATRIAEQELGRRIVANIVMLGALTAISDVVSDEAMRKAVLDSVPKGTEELNMKAFGRGYGYTMGMLGEGGC
ncbi:MAG: 2-oxoacid:acceptor oxidoreductase family protein [Chloroflexota bacterium]|nr:2-oxoacid:acceptor oxidoreductase family protein [Chloroflexota bacterium]